MKTIAIAVALLPLLAMGASAQDAPKAPLHQSSQEMIDALAKGADKSGFYNQTVQGRGQDFMVMTTSRVKTGQAEMHVHWNDYIFIEAGETHYTLGGTMVNPKEVGPGEVRGDSVTGGKIFTAKTGDYIYVPAGVVHRMELAPGGTIRYVVFKTRE